jgi:phosphomethylpyrimidine synthase
MCGPKFCSMEITQQIRDYANLMSLSENQALSQGLKQKSEEFMQTGAEIYVKL